MLVAGQHPLLWQIGKRSVGSAGGLEAEAQEMLFELLEVLRNPDRYKVTIRDGELVIAPIEEADSFAGEDQTDRIAKEETATFTRRSSIPPEVTQNASTSKAA